MPRSLTAGATLALASAAGMLALVSYDKATQRDGVYSPVANTAAPAPKIPVIIDPLSGAATDLTIITPQYKPPEVLSIDAYRGMLLFAVKAQQPPSDYHRARQITERGADVRLQMPETRRLAAHLEHHTAYVLGAALRLLNDYLEGTPDYDAGGDLTLTYRDAHRLLLILGKNENARDKTLAWFAERQAEFIAAHKEVRLVRLFMALEDAESPVPGWEETTAAPGLARIRQRWANRVYPAQDDTVWSDASRIEKAGIAILGRNSEAVTRDSLAVDPLLHARLRLLKISATPEAEKEVLRQHILRAALDIIAHERVGKPRSGKPTSHIGTAFLMLNSVHDVFGPQQEALVALLVRKPSARARIKMLAEKDADLFAQGHSGLPPYLILFSALAETQAASVSAPPRPKSARPAKGTGNAAKQTLRPR